MKQVLLTDEELNALLQLIDIAIKSGGLNVAEAGVVLARKMNQAEDFADKAEEPEKVEE